MAPHSSTLAWKTPWIEEPGRLQSMGSLRVGHDWETSLSLFTFMHWRRKWQPTPVFLPGKSHGRALEKEMATHSSVLAWRIPGTGEPGGLLSMGSHRVRHDWSDLAATAAAACSLPWFSGRQEFPGLSLSFKVRTTNNNHIWYFLNTYCVLGSVMDIVSFNSWQTCEIEDRTESQRAN